jgi:hypothetical protein
MAKPAKLNFDWRPRWSDVAIVAAILFAFHPTLTDSAHLPYDAEFFHFPLLREVQGLFSSGTLPGWDPYTYGGSPLLANSQSAWLYPPHLLLDVFYAVSGGSLTEHALDVVVILHLALAGLVTGAIARRRGLGDVAACYAGVFVVLFGGTITQAEHVGLLEALPWAALSVLAIERLASGISALRVAALAVAFALMITAGFVPVVPAAVAMALGVALARGEGRRDAGLGTVAGVALGVLIAAAALIPAAALLHVYPPLPDHNSLPTGHLVTALLPTAFGHWTSSLAGFTGMALTNSYFYLGATGIVLLPIAITSGRAALRETALVLVLALASFGAVGQSIANLIQGLPSIGVLWRPEDVVYVAAVPFALLVARGLARPPSRVQLGAAALTLAVLALVQFSGGHGVPLHLLADVPAQTLIGLAATAVTLVVAALLRARHPRAAVGALAVTAAIGIVELAATVPARYYINAPGRATSSGPAGTGDDPSVLTFLREHLGPQQRFAADVPSLPAVWAGFPPVWGVADANGFQPQFSKYELAVAEAGGSGPPLGSREFTISPALRGYLQALAVRYVVASAATDRFAHAPGYVPVFRDNAYHVYRTPWSAARAYGIDLACRGTAGSCATSIPVTTTVSSVNTRTYRFPRTGGAALVVTGEPWYPGWQAHDGSGSLDVARVGFVAAVRVPAGVDRVTMTYVPPGLVLGLVLSGLGVAGTLGLVVRERRRRGNNLETPRQVTPTT